MQEIDFVLTWVDGSDPAWRAERAPYMKAAGLKDDVRFRDWGLLKYWFRGVEKFAPWVRKIHFVTWGHIPEWLDTSNPKLNIVKHSDFIPEKYLPTFNSHTIELNLHRIDGLADQFVYFNDDFFITKEVPSDYFFENGLPKDTFGLRVIEFASNTNCMIYANDTKVINDNFNVNEVFKRHGKLLYSLKNGKKAINTMKTRILCKSFFPGFYSPHVHFCFLKSTYDEVWAKAEKEMDETCMSRFREPTNVGPTLLRDWQYVEGKFIPRTGREARAIHLADKYIPYAVKTVLEQPCYVVCINDVYELKSFERAKREITSAFEQLLPQKCSFEI